MTGLSSREKFIKFYYNLPLPERDKAAYVDEKKGPISWNISYLEITHETELGKEILKYLEELNLI